MLTTTLTLFLSLVSLALSLPSPFHQLHVRDEGPGSPYECEAKYDATSRKKSLQNMGANSLDLAITILETCSMSGQAYPYGDQSPDGTPKTEDAANFGLFKNNSKLKEKKNDSNWAQQGGTIRANCAQFQGQGASDWRNGAVLNTDDAAAIKCQHEQIDKLGEGGFYEKQRGVPGQGGSYGNAVGFIKEYLDQGHLNDDWVTYYNLNGV
ncbi:MAG: hypothetical protein Q9167_003627 [Letrouitia subvulpina]